MGIFNRNIMKPTNTSHCSDLDCLPFRDKGKQQSSKELSKVTNIALRGMNGRAIKTVNNFSKDVHLVETCSGKKIQLYFAGALISNTLDVIVPEGFSVEKSIEAVIHHRSSWGIYQLNANQVFIGKVKGLLGGARETSDINAKRKDIECLHNVLCLELELVSNLYPLLLSLTDVMFFALPKDSLSCLFTLQDTVSTVNVIACRYQDLSNFESDQYDRALGALKHALNRIVQPLRLFFSFFEETFSAASSTLVSPGSLDEVREQLSTLKSNLLRLLNHYARSEQGDPPLQQYARNFSSFKEKLEQLYKLFREHENAIINSGLDHLSISLREKMGKDDYTIACIVLDEILELRLQIFGQLKGVWQSPLMVLQHLYIELKAEDLLLSLHRVKILYQEAYDDHIQRVERQCKQLDMGLRAFFCHNFEEAIRWQQILLFHKKWIHLLDSEINKISEEYPNKIGLFYALRIKQSLSNGKERAYLSFFNQTKGAKLEVLKELEKEIGSENSPKKVVDKLRQTVLATEGNIRNKETALKKYGWPVAVTAFCVRLVTENFFYRTARDFFLWEEEFTQNRQFKNIPIVRNKLEEPFLSFFKTFSATGSYFVNAYMTSNYVASSLAITSSLQISVSDVQMLIYFARRVGLSETKLFQHYRLFTTLPTMGIFPLIYGWQNTLSIGLVYGVAHLTTLGTDLLHDASYGILPGKMPLRLPPNYKNTKRIVGIASYVLGNQIGVKVLEFSVNHTFNYPQHISLIHNDLLCDAETKRCLEESLKILGKGRDCSLEDAKLRYKELSLLWHPDKASNHPEQYIRSGEAFVDLGVAWGRIKKHL